MKRFEGMEVVQGEGDTGWEPGQGAAVKMLCEAACSRVCWFNPCGRGLQ